MECFDILYIKINEHGSMLWCLWITYILFAANFKEKINTNGFRRFVPHIICNNNQFSTP